ncbi:MAG: CDP-alcohol phosphatidyltransferase family protein [Clostridia bacterium]|nr:CDP-alcohol phosphatidyltransferase family protein [Clostridia bacterium]
MPNVRERLTKKTIFTIPNILSFLRILLIPLMMWLYLGKGDILGAVIVLLVSSLTDVVDGFIARKFNMISDLGKLLDPIADKLTQGCLLIALAITHPKLGLLIALFVVKEAVMLTFGILCFRRTDTVNSSHWYGKACTVILEGSAIAILAFPNMPELVSDLLMDISIVAVLFSCAMYVRFYLLLMKKSLVENATGKRREKLVDLMFNRMPKVGGEESALQDAEAKAEETTEEHEEKLPAEESSESGMDQP